MLIDHRLATRTDVSNDFPFNQAYMCTSRVLFLLLLLRLFIQTLALLCWALSKRFSREVETRVVVSSIASPRTTTTSDSEKEEEEEHQRFGNKR